MKSEKLLDATMKALQVNLNEGLFRRKNKDDKKEEARKPSINKYYKQVSEYIISDYHRVEDFTDLEVCYPEEEDDEWLDAYMVAGELLNKLSEEDWKQMAKEIEDDTIDLADWGSKAGSLEEARSHKEDNEKAAPRRDRYSHSRERVYGKLDNVPKRARYDKSKDINWGYFNDSEAETYKKGTDDIEQYKAYKTDAESERALARYHNANAQQSDNLASDIVRDKKLARAKNTLNGQQTSEVEEAKKTESEETADSFINKFKDTNKMYSYVVDYLENDIPNNTEMLNKCEEILDKGAINVCGLNIMKDFYSKYKSDIEARINELGEDYIGAILAEYVFEDIIYGLEDNLRNELSK